MGLPQAPQDGSSALPDGTFDGRIIVVTGGGTGLGKGIAREFARLGATIAIWSRSPDHLDAGRESIESLGAKVITVGCDIREPDQVAGAFDDTQERVGMPDVLVNNAAGNFPVPAEDISPNGWRAVTRIILDGTFFCCREFGRRHIAAGTPGN